MTNNIAQIVGGVLVVLSAVTAFALSQPDYVLPPFAKFALGCTNVGVTALALYLQVRMPGQAKP